jgi:hypothetical protein
MGIRPTVASLGIPIFSNFQQLPLPALSQHRQDLGAEVLGRMRSRRYDDMIESANHANTMGGERDVSRNRVSIPLANHKSPH